MKKITLTAVLFALCFATGFTCSKNAPQQTAQPVETTPAAQTTTTTQENMATAPANSEATTSETTTPAVEPTTPEAHK